MSTVKKLSELSEEEKIRVINQERRQRGDGHPYGLRVMIHETGHMYIMLVVKHAHTTIRHVKDWIIN